MTIPNGINSHCKCSPPFLYLVSHKQNNHIKTNCSNQVSKFFMWGRNKPSMMDASHLTYLALANYSYTSQQKQNENLHKTEWHTRAGQEGDCDRDIITGRTGYKKSYQRHSAAAELCRALKRNELQFNSLIYSLFLFPHL